MGQNDLMGCGRQERWCKWKMREGSEKERVDVESVAFIKKEMKSKAFCEGKSKTG